MTPVADNPRVTPPQYPFRHHLPVQMRFTDIDMLGHLNNNVYLSFMDLAKLEYFKAIDPEQTLDNIPFVVVHIDCDFIAPSYYGESLEVVTTISHVGKHSVRLEQRIINTATGQTKSVSNTVMAGFDPATATSAEIDPRWIALAEAYEQRPLITQR